MQYSDLFITCTQVMWRYLCRVMTGNGTVRLPNKIHRTGLRKFYNRMTTTVLNNGEMPEPFSVTNGVKTGSSALCLLGCFTTLHNRMTMTSNSEICILIEHIEEFLNSEANTMVKAHMVKK